MLEMLKARKAELEARGKKGFTLMEMLIVIAIIAVLIAIAIPVFTSQLDSADKATTEANGRSIYAMLTADYMDDQKYNTATESGLDNKVINKDNPGTVGGQKFEAKGQYQITLHLPANAAPWVEVGTSSDSGSVAVFGS